MFDWFALSLLALIATIAAFIVRAVRMTNASIARASRDVPLSRPDVARRLAERVREQRERCPRCRGDASAALGTSTGYRCDTCRHEFDGPPHIPTGRE